MNAIKRHHHFRLLKLRRKTFRYSFHKNSGVYVNTPKICSCMGCGNPRKYFNQDTHQENISKLKMSDQCEEIDY